ncbi:MAG: hypothetical protein ACO3CR_03045 [Solirubrobacterales bacterium]
MSGIPNGSDPFLARFLKRLALTLSILVFAPLALAACGGSDSGGEGGEAHGGEELVVEGEPFEVGPLRYNVLFSRPLNRFDVEDRDYLVGQRPAGPDELYLGVFMEIQNTDNEKGHEIPETFEIFDTEGQKFENLETESIYRLDTGTVLGPGDQAPAEDSTPQVGPIKAALLLYRIDQATLELRPIEMEIPGEEDGEVIRVELDT